MSIYASIEGLGDLGDDETVGAPWIYQGSHILPADNDPRGGSVGVAVIPSHITRDGRDDQPEDGRRWPWLRLSIDVPGGDPTVILNPAQARYLRDQLDSWLNTQGPSTGTDPELTAEEARTLADDLGTQLYKAQDALEFVEECCVIADRQQEPITTAHVREWLKGARCGRQLAADAQAATQATEPHHACKTTATTYYCPTSGQTESDCHGGFDQCCDRPELHRVASPCPACQRADQAGLALSELHPECAKEQQ
jgi:hypothetical protein